MELLLNFIARPWWGNEFGFITYTELTETSTIYNAALQNMKLCSSIYLLRKFWIMQIIKTVHSVVVKTIDNEFYAIFYTIAAIKDIKIVAM